MNNIKVKCFENCFSGYLEKDINKFLTANDYEIVDIKYSASNAVRDVGEFELFSCLIIYKEKENK